MRRFRQLRSRGRINLTTIDAEHAKTAEGRIHCSASSAVSALIVMVQFCNALSVLRAVVERLLQEMKPQERQYPSDDLARGLGIIDEIDFV